MEVARISDMGQITVPIYIRQKLRLKNGDKVIFMEDGNNIIIANAAKVAFAKIHDSFNGEAERLSIRNECDVVELVDEIRQEMWEELYANND